MPPNGKKNVVRSIRMDKDMEDFLNRETESKHLTFNNLVNSILQKYSEFGTFAERFGFITITRNTFQALVEVLSVEEMDTISRDISSLALKEFTFFKYNDPGIKAFIDFLSILCNYGGLGMFEEKINGLEHRIIIRHNMGSKVSQLLGKIMSETIKRIGDIEVAIPDSSSNELTINFKMYPFNL